MCDCHKFTHTHMYVCTLFLFDKIYLVCSPITGSPWTPQLSLHNYYVRGF